MLLDLISLKEKYDLKINGVIHIGAHYGQEAKLYDDLNIPKENRHYFEPQPAVFNILKENIKDNGNLYNFALGNEDKVVDMNIEYSNNSQSSSILEPKIHIKQYPHIVFSGKIKVPMKRLDDIQINKCNFINIDVQGYEMEVFKGGLNTLENIDYIISEVNRDEVYQNCTQIEELDIFLSKLNFVRVETSWDGVTWGDALYVKNNG
jgi:FkbM family methyltransferase